MQSNEVTDIIVDEAQGPAPVEVEDPPNVHDRKCTIRPWCIHIHCTVVCLYRRASGGRRLICVDDAYANKAMPDLGLEIADFQAQTWKIEKWSQQPKRLVGPEFSCGGHKW